ncbi:MAG: hypothetical protein JF606_08055 [Burkholderiales bacterium]|nr:hypothetical protein [Burkholderiales bacterium]
MLATAAAVSLVSSPRCALRSLLLFSPLLAIYLIGGLEGYALMTAVFALAMPAVGRSLNSIVAQRRRRIVALLFVIALVPAAVAAFGLEFDSLWSSQYGRPRLLMGYWHPKEAGTSFALPLLLFLLVSARRPGGIQILLLTALLWVIGSRNVALAMGISIGLWRYPRAAVPLLVTLVVAVVALVLVLGYSYEFFDEITSLRLTVWLEALADPPGATDDGSTLGSRLAIDSYYVEVLASAGVAGLLVFGAWVATFNAALANIRPHARLAKACFWAILFFSGFDSGIVSTGNLLHVVLWAFAASPLLLRHRRRLTRRRAAIQFPPPSRLPARTESP